MREGSAGPRGPRSQVNKKKNTIGFEDSRIQGFKRSGAEKHWNPRTLEPFSLEELQESWIPGFKGSSGQVLKNTGILDPSNPRTLY